MSVPRRLLALLGVLAVLVAACGGAASSEIDSAAPAQAETAASEAQAPAVDPLPGRAALAAARADGTPHILWFWGAH